MLVNRGHLAQIFGVNLTTVDDFVRQGMPYKQKASVKGKQPWEFETKYCIIWYATKDKAKAPEDDGDTLAQAKFRERSAVAGLREYELAEKQKEMVNVADVAAQVEEEYAVVKSRLRAIPGRLAQPLSVVSDPSSIERLIKIEVDSALESLSTEF